MEIPKDINLNYSCFSDPTVEVSDLKLAVVYANNLIESAVKQWNNYLQKRRNKYIVSATDYLKTHYKDCNLSLSDVATILGINANYLSKLFKNNIGTNYVDYINQLRIEEAKKLLLSKNGRIGEIGSKVGFGSQQNFIKVFHRIEGMTPGQFRENYIDKITK